MASIKQYGERKDNISAIVSGATNVLLFLPKTISIWGFLFSIDKICFNSPDLALLWQIINLSSVKIYFPS